MSGSVQVWNWSMAVWNGYAVMWVEGNQVLPPHHLEALDPPHCLHLQCWRCQDPV